MNGLWDCVVTFADGTTERVEDVGKEHVKDGVLYLLAPHETAYGGMRGRLGAYSLCGIRKWERVVR